MLRVKLFTNKISTILLNSSTTTSSIGILATPTSKNLCIYYKFYFNRSHILRASTILTTQCKHQPKQQQQQILIKKLNYSNLSDLDEKKRVFTIPNLLTVGRIVMTPLISYLMFSQSYVYATTLFFLVGFTDFLDGYIARNFKNQKSYLGSILDPAADKLFIGIMTITLGVCKLMPFEIMFIILARDLALILSSIIVRFNLIDKPRTFKKFFNISEHSSVKIEASKISKLNTFLQICLIGLTIPSELFSYNDSIYLKSLQYLTATTTVLSGLQYLLSKGSYKVSK